MVSEKGPFELAQFNLSSDVVMNFTEASVGKGLDALPDAMPIHPCETSSSSNIAVKTHFTTVGFVISGFLVGVFGASCVLIVWNAVRRRRQNPSGRVNQQRIQGRYDTVEHWIISKLVQPHDAFCSTVVSKFCHHDATAASNDAGCSARCSFGPGVLTESNEEGNMTTPISSSPVESSSSDLGTDDEERSSGITSLQKDEDDVRECPICMSELLQGEIVSWSANEQCSHVYHHECIKEWLLRHSQCCMCKHIYLPVDEKHGKAKIDALDEMSHRFAAAVATSYYCVETGLVRISKTVRCTRQELLQLENRIFSGAVTPSKLVTLRGSRQESSATRNGQDQNQDPLQITETNDSTSTDDRIASEDLTASFDSIDYAKGALTAVVSEARGTLASDLELGSSSLGELHHELLSTADNLAQNSADRCINPSKEGGAEDPNTTSQRPYKDDDLTFSHVDYSV